MTNTNRAAAKAFRVGDTFRDELGYIWTVTAVLNASTYEAEVEDVRGPSAWVPGSRHRFAACDMVAR